MAVREKQHCACRTNGILLCLHLFFFFLRFIYFSAVLGLRCFARAFSTCGEWIYSSLRVAFLLRWLLLSRSLGSRCTRASVIVLLRLSCSSAKSSLATLPVPGLNLPGPGIEPVSCTGRWILTHYTTREVLFFFFFKK